MCKAKITERIPDPRYWSSMQISCAEHNWSSTSISYAQQIADYQQHKKEMAPYTI